MEAVTSRWPRMPAGCTPGDGAGRRGLAGDRRTPRGRCLIPRGGRRPPPASTPPAGRRRATGRPAGGPCQRRVSSAPVTGLTSPAGPARAGEAVRSGFVGVRPQQ